MYELFIFRSYPKNGICIQKYHFWPKNDGEKWPIKILEGGYFCNWICDFDQNVTFEYRFYFEGKNDAKGQTKSKQFFLSQWLFQKTNERIPLCYDDTSDRLVFVCCLEETQDIKKTFRNQLTFRTIHILCVNGLRYCCFLTFQCDFRNISAALCCA